MFAVPVTLAVNGWVWEAVRAAESGVKEMRTDDVAAADTARANRQNHKRIPMRIGVAAEPERLAVTPVSADPL
jgi:hypothetical protein